ncbi:MAG: hypothetical protein M3137_02435, partial [Actinomycetota bacterium]|nr:hypothetical protein [Actinomycetota bacterium]
MTEDPSAVLQDDRVRGGFVVRKSWAFSALALTLLLGAVGCGSSGDKSTAGAPGSSPTTAPKATGPVTAFAAASLTESFNDLQAALK